MKLDTVEPGTILSYSETGKDHHGTVQVITVSRREVSCSDGFRYLRSTGRRYGSGADTEAPTVSPLTGEDTEKERLRELARSVAGRAMVIHKIIGRSDADAETNQHAREALKALAYMLTEALEVE